MSFFFFFSPPHVCFLSYTYTEVVDKRCKTVDQDGPTKLIELISDCGWEEDDSKAVNITTQHVTSGEPQSFKLGSFNIELMQENKNGEKSPSGTLRSRVKIAMSAEKQIRPVPAKQRPVKWKVENVKPPDEEPEDAPADKEAKSHGGKGLPFYTKVIPAGKLIARLKTSDINEAELVEVFPVCITCLMALHQISCHGGLS